MLGLMMDTPLTLTVIMRHGDRNHARREIVSVTHDHALHRYTFADCFARTRRLANALDRLGAGPAAVAYATRSIRACSRSRSSTS